VLSAGAAHAATCPTASQIVTDINANTSTAAGLTQQLGAVNQNSSPINVRAAAESTTNGLNTLSANFSQDTGVSNGCPALSSADAQKVANAFDDLTKVTNQLLSILIGDHPVFAQYGFTAPISASLRSLEGALDSYAFSLISVAPSQQGAITEDQNSIDTSLGNAITTYSQICIPSPLYPTVQPVCVSV
jgi:hypothetical protein